MRVLMCPPLHFEILEENPRKNPWMKKEAQPNKHLAWQQWKVLAETLSSLKAKVFFIEPQAGLGDMCFSANAAWGKNKIFFMANFQPEIHWRKKEVAHYAVWLVRKHLVQYLPEKVYFEGQGDIVTLKHSYIFGQGERNSPETVDHLALFFKSKRFTKVRLVDPKFYHLDMSLHFARSIDAVIWYPGAFDNDSQKEIERTLKQEGLKSLELYLDEAIQNLGNNRFNFLLNSIYIGPNEIMGWDEKHSEFPPRVKWFIKNLGGKIQTVNLSEFSLSGGGARCLTLFLD